MRKGIKVCIRKGKLVIRIIRVQYCLRARGDFMKNKSIALIVCALFIGCAVMPFVDLASVEGKENIPEPMVTYSIYDVNDLQDMNLDLDGDYILENDIDASDTINWNGGLGFSPIGNPSTQFTGTMDGQGFIVHDFYINRPSQDYCALFGRMSSITSITDLGLVDVDITGKSYTGSLFGESFGTITNCFSTGDVEGDQRTGGLAGSYGGANTLSDCYFDGDVVGSDGTGGLAGFSSATIERCYS